MSDSMNLLPFDHLLEAINKVVSRGLFEISITVVSQGAFISGTLVSPQTWLEKQSEIFGSVPNGEALKLVFDELGAVNGVDEVLLETLRNVEEIPIDDIRSQLLHLVSEGTQPSQHGVRQLWRVRLHDVSAWSFGIAS